MKTCHRGHALTPDNVYARVRADRNGKVYPRCRRCAIEAARASRRGDTIRRAYLSAQPLIDAAPGWIGGNSGRDDGYAAMGGIRAVLPKHLERAYHRAQASGRLTYGMADELAVALGYHPSELWGDAWWALPDEEAG